VGENEEMGPLLADLKGCHLGIVECVRKLDALVLRTSDLGVVKTGQMAFADAVAGRKTSFRIN
jgi:hypothetical protein